MENTNEGILAEQNIPFGNSLAATKIRSIEVLSLVDNWRNFKKLSGNASTSEGNCCQLNDDEKNRQKEPHQTEKSGTHHMAKITPKMAIVFTCKVCSTRQVIKSLFMN